ASGTQAPPHDTDGPATGLRLEMLRMLLILSIPAVAGSGVSVAFVTTATRAPSLTAFCTTFAVIHARLNSIHTRKMSMMKGKTARNSRIEVPFALASPWRSFMATFLLGIAARWGVA